MPPFISCPRCACAVRPLEAACPHCHATLPSTDRRVTRTATAIALGLVGIAGCGEVPVATKYGVPATDMAPPEPTTSASAAPAPEAVTETK